MKTDAAWANACAAITRNDPHTRGIVVLGLEAPTDELAASFAVAARHDLVKGFAVGRTIFADAARAWLGGAITDGEAVDDMAGKIRTPLPASGTRRARAREPPHEDHPPDRRPGDVPLPEPPSCNEDGVPFLAGCWAIFGHGNVAGIGEALYAIGDDFPTWRGHNEQGMAHAAIAYAKALNRKRAMAVTTSIGPGALNLVTACALAHVNRLPVLFLPGDVFANRAPDPVLQQLEDFNDGTMTVNDAFKPISRYFDRIMRPEQLLSALPRAFATMTDPAECGPVTLAFCQDVQAEAYDWPVEFFAPKEWHRRRPRPGLREVKVAADAIRGAKRPLIIAGGGVLYAEATAALQGLRREAQHPRRRDPGGQVVDALGPSAEPRLDRRHRLGRHQRRRRGGGRDRRRRHPAAGLHHRLLGAVPGREPRGSSRSTSRPTTPTSTTPCRWSPTRAWRSTSSRQLLGDHRAPDVDARLKADWIAAVDKVTRRPGRQRAADRHAGDRRGAAQPRPTTPSSSAPPAACRASCTSSGRRRGRTATTSNTASRPWATRSPAASGSRWRTRTARWWSWSATAAT